MGAIRGLGRESSPQTKSITLLNSRPGFCIVKWHPAGIIWTGWRGEIVKEPGGRINPFPGVISLLFLFGCLAGGCQGLPRRLSVCQVQGKGLASPYLDQEVILTGLVIADLEVIEPGGFLILDQACPADEDGSPGLYLSLVDGGELLDVGDQIRVRGLVREIAGETRLEASLPDLEILSLDNKLPGPTDLADDLIPPLVFGYEKWEGQLVAIPRADLLENPGIPGAFQALPRLEPDPSRQLVCFQEASFVLDIDQGLLGSGEGALQAGHQAEDLVGVIRQDQRGYYLLLVKQPGLKLAKTDPRNEESSQASPAGSLQNTPGITDAPTKSPTPTPEPSRTPTLTSSPTLVPSPTYYPVRLLIVEVLPNPTGEEPGGEWIEIYYPEGRKLPLNGIKIGDETSPAGREGMLRFPSGYFIHPGQVLVIANQARVFESRYGFLPDFELNDSSSRVPDLLPYSRWGGSTVKLANSGDQVLLVDPWDQVVDQVVYGDEGIGGFSPPVAAPKEGHSLERYPAEEDRDQAADWRESDSPSPGRLDLSTPTMTATQTHTPSPSQGSPLPSGTASGSVTPTVPQPSSSPTETSPASLTPSPSQAWSLTPSSAATLQPTGIPSATPGMTHSPSPPSPTVTPPPANSITPTSPETAAPSPTPTVEATPTPAPWPWIVFNEILADPDPILGDSNGDGQISSDDDEFLELVNLSAGELDLSGWQVFDAARLRYTFPEGTSLACGSALVLFGGGDPTGDFGGSLVLTAGSLGLNNAGDTLSLVDPAGVEAAAVGYGSEGAQDQSLTRNPDLFGPLPLVLHSQVPAAGGALFSPGTRIDGGGFGGCR